MAYPDVELFIAGKWSPALGNRSIDVLNPATGERLGRVARAEPPDLDLAVQAAQAGFDDWQQRPALERATFLRTAAGIIRQRVNDIAELMTLENGKPIAEARAETALAGDVLDWFAGEAQRTYGRVIPARRVGVTTTVVKVPVGPVAAFTPWNFPINQSIRKIAAALAAGCSIIVKGPEETPAALAEVIRAMSDAGLPGGVVNLVYGVPAQISEYLIPHPVIRKVSFTGSVEVGKHLAAMAGRHMKRTTMELGGHAPVLVFDDVDVPAVVGLTASNKFRASGQSCVSPTRFLVQRGVYDAFVAEFVQRAQQIQVGEGLAKETQMGPVASERRLESVQRLVDDAREKGATLEIGGQRLPRTGFFFEPTVISGLTIDMRIMNEEPFGPVALMIPFDWLDDAVAEANRLPVGLGAYVFTNSGSIADELARRIDVGMVTINHLGLTLPELPFGGVGDSGYGSEGGAEAIEAYLVPKLITELRAAE